MTIGHFLRPLGLNLVRGRSFDAPGIVAPFGGQRDFLVRGSEVDHKLVVCTENLVGIAEVNAGGRYSKSVGYEIRTKNRAVGRFGDKEPERENFGCRAVGHSAEVCARSPRLLAISTGQNPPENVSRGRIGGARGTGFQKVSELIGRQLGLGREAGSNRPAEISRDLHCPIRGLSKRSDQQ